MSWPDMSCKRARVAPILRNLAPPAPVRVVVDWRSVLPSPAIALITEFLTYPHLAKFEAKYGTRCPAAYEGYDIMGRDAHRLRARHTWRIETQHWRYIPLGSLVLITLNNNRQTQMDPRRVLAIHPQSLTIDYDGARSHMTQIKHVDLFVDIPVRR